MIDFDNIKDVDDEFDELEQLEDLFEDLDYDEPTSDQLYKIYGIFLDNFVNNPVLLSGVELKINRNRSKHPICRGKFMGFEHIITRESKHSGKRDFDRERANKVHWIRPIIENVSDVRIKYFERINSDELNQRFYWYEEKNFIVIIRETIPGYFLVTAFCVDDTSYAKYRRYFDDYRETKRQKKTSLRK